MEGLDVAYRRFDSPLGRLLLAASRRGLLQVAYLADPQDEDRVLERLAAAISPRLVNAPRRLDRVACQLEEYFCGRRRRQRFQLALDLQLIDGFHRTVLTCLAQVPYGETVSYAALALTAGRPRAVRAVGSACARNPLPIVIPCHRVLRSDGSLGGYRGGGQAKIRLLELEGARSSPRATAGARGRLLELEGSRAGVGGAR